MELPDVLADLVRREGTNLVGLVLSGSAGRGVATERSDLDVYAVLKDTAGRGTTRSAALDLMPVTLDDLERVPPFGSPNWWYRWSFAWAPVLLDRTGGRLPEAVRRQATVTAEEAESILVEHDRLDGWLNFAYRALKNDRDGNALECRLDAAESVPWLLDVIFSLAGRVRPYNKYLPWELDRHPLPDWDSAELLALLTAMLDGDAAAVRAAVGRVTELCRDRPVPAAIIAEWGDELS